MLLLQMFDKLNIELFESVSTYDMNIKTCPLYVGLLGMYLLNSYAGN